MKSKNIWFSSDHHFGHYNVIKYCDRPFDPDCITLEDKRVQIGLMNNMMVERWNSKVGFNDVVYYLGDFSLDVKNMEYYMPKLNGQIHLIVGNHDKCFKDKPAQRKRYYDSGFLSIKHRDEIQIGKHKVMMCHFPYWEDHGEGLIRYHERRPKNQGQWLLCGHIHEKWKIKDRQINVGVDVWDFNPVHIDEIEAIIN